MTVYLPGGQEVTTGPDGALSAVRYYALSGRTVASRTDTSGSSVRSLVSDAQGTAHLAITNTTGLVTRRYTDPYGNPRGQAMPWVGDRGFLDKPVDASGLSAVGARYYDPTLGRFITVDPVMDLTDPAQWHGYSYANNNPVTYTDPTGLLSWIKNGFNKARNAVGNAAGASWRFVKKHQSTIVGVTVGVVVTSGCLVATGGAGSIGCAALGGAASSAATNLWETKVQRTRKFSWTGLATDTVIGAASGALGGAVGARLAGLSKPMTGQLTRSQISRAPSPRAPARAPAAKPTAPTSTRSGTAPPGANTAGLEARANAVHGALDPIAQNSRTTAALGTRQGQTVLAGGGRDLSPAQRALAQSDEIVARSPGAHAEVTAVGGAQSAGLTPQGIGVSRPICPACQTFLEESGATITSPTTAWWFG